MDISIRSEGCNDPDKTPETCGIAYIKVDGVEQSPKGRGHNVVVVDLTTGSVLFEGSTRVQIHNSIQKHEVFN